MRKYSAEPQGLAAFFCFVVKFWFLLFDFYRHEMTIINWKACRSIISTDGSTRASVKPTDVMHRNIYVFIIPRSPN